VPAELRDEQLAVLHDIKPPVALIAGGRPSQAAPLEAAGIATYLHVPSPGLLDLFLEGRRAPLRLRGPRVRRPRRPALELRAVGGAARAAARAPAVAEVSVLFAGGIHDARSARWWRRWRRRWPRAAPRSAC
jgi:hypothetical protein